MPQALNIDISSLVPHAGAMILLDQVVEHGPLDIHCRARITSAEHHPLAMNDALPGPALAEYGAQAMAVHGGLLAPAGQPPRPGRLVALSRLDLTVDRITGPVLLDVRASRLGGDESGQIYSFTVHEGEHELASGQATIMFPKQADPL